MSYEAYNRHSQLNRTVVVRTAVRFNVLLTSRYGLVLTRTIVLTTRLSSQLVQQPKVWQYKDPLTSCNANLLNELHFTNLMVYTQTSTAQTNNYRAAGLY